jgi:hypothetical protein
MKPMKLGLSLAILGLSTVAAYAAASADQAKVEAALKAQGYTHWKTIVLDNGTWEVDDAINAAGKQFDLRIDANSLKITNSIPE